MSIPTTECQPDGFHRAPQNQPRQVREALRTANPKRLSDFIDDLFRRNQLNAAFIWQLLISLVLLAVGLIADLPLLVLLAAVVAPLFSPMIGIVIATLKPSGRHFGRSLLFLVVAILAFFGLGYLISLINQNAISIEGLKSFFVLSNGWIEWLVLAVTAIFSAYLFLYRSNGYVVLPSAVFVYLIFIPICLAGFFYATGEQSLALQMLSLSSARFFVSLFVMSIVVWIEGFSPKASLGWIIFAVIFMLAVFGLVENYDNQILAMLPEPEGEKAALIMPEETLPSPTPAPATATSMPTLPAKPSPTAQAKPTETVEPIIRQATVNSESGVVVREAPSTSAVIVTYINNGQRVTLLDEQANADGMDWERVIAPDGKEGWVGARFLVEVEP
ncbi:MAG: SH3 domain-containing protein [Anaerolineaceae bacterium]|nr:SH3 domain-containing protein [Anaerolineaceae bacterium]